MTRFPDHEWLASWATTSTLLRSPAMRVGVTVVKLGFSMPPYGNDFGRTRMSYVDHSYGMTSFSAIEMKDSVSAENSY